MGYLKYVKLPNVCYNCGMLTHETKLCQTNNVSRERMYGNWLRAEDRGEFILEWTEASMEDRYLSVSPTNENDVRSMGGNRNMVFEDRENSITGKPESVRRRPENNEVLPEEVEPSQMELEVVTQGTSNRGDDDRS